MEEDLEYSSQIEEEEDIFFDDDSVTIEEGEEQQLTESNNDNNKDNSFRNLLAGPSTNKAGMGTVDKDRVNRIIYEASKGSAFFEREKKRDEAVTKRIQAILNKYELIRNQDLTFERKIADKTLNDLEKTRDLTQCICHIDMDAFYASVEELERPELKSKPMAVGGQAMLCTSNYEARKYGVRSAMPGFIALKLCPQLEIIPLHFDKYRAASDKVRAVFSKYDPDFLPMSLDEAYLNLTNYLQQTGMSPSELVQQIRNEIFECTQLTASADRAHIMEFVKDLKIRQIPGVGRVTERVLQSLGVDKCGDIYTHRAVLYKLLSPISFQFLLRSYLGIGHTFFNSETARKSMSVERTFSSMSEPNELFAKLKELAELLEKDLKQENLMGRNIGIKLKHTSFELRVRSKTVPSAIWTAHDIERFAKELLKRELPVKIRLMGIRMASLEPRISEEESVAKYFSKVASSSTITTIISTTPLVPLLPESSDNQHIIPSSSNISDDNNNPTIPLLPPTSPSVSENPILTCPICNCHLQMDNTSFNHHVDICLNKVEVKSILKTQLGEDRITANSPLRVRKKTKRSDNNRHTLKTNSKSLLDYFAEQ
ncbi:DNA/RNA polymerase [Backusella circina FSU 941]|nr:DNA/RNA polymerase [Backusella circina FSU 941]